MTSSRSLRDLPMVELTLTLLQDHDAPDFDTVHAEVQRRWHAAREQKALAWQGFGNDERWNEIEPLIDHGAIEQARLYLATQTLVHQLWVLQEAGVIPSELYQDTTAPARVRAILTREQQRNEATYDDNDQILSEPEPLGDAAGHLAYWSELALFGRGTQLLEDQRRLAGNMRQDLLLDRFTLCHRALAELHGPWTVQAFLANPLGKRHYQPQPPHSTTLDIGVDVALGLPGQIITADDVQAAHDRLAADLAGEMQRVIREDPPTVPDDLGASYDTLERRIRLHASMVDSAQFFTTAFGLASLAADTTVRVDGFTVPDENVPGVLGLLRGTTSLLNGYRGTVSAAGLRAHFVTNREIEGGVVAVADVAGVRKELHPQSLVDLLAALRTPQPVTFLAKMHVGIAQLGERLAAERSATAVPSKRQRLAQHARPGTPGTRHQPPHPQAGRTPPAR